MNNQDLSVHGLTLESYQERIEELERSLNDILKLTDENIPKRAPIEGWDEYRFSRIKSIAARVLNGTGT